MPRQTWRAVEFYSGIGGWAYAAALQQDVEFDIVLSLDVSTTCNEIYALNWGRRPTARAIESLDDLPEADAWLLSPPCQPHTRQHDKGDDLADPRSASFRRLCELVASRPPRRLVCLENVVGFGESASCSLWHQALAAAGFHVRAWETSPTDFGEPCSRPRYFEAATRSRPAAPVPLRTFARRWLREYLEDDDESLIVPPHVLAKPSAWCLDVLTKDTEQAAACFTKSYGRFVRGTGSVLCLDDVDLDAEGLARVDPQHRAFASRAGEWPRLRYFSPREIANLLGFPADLRFPTHLGRRVQWAALGNSLHVPTAAAVLATAVRAAQDPP